MVATTNTYIDGQWYMPGEEIWDLGSFVAVPPTQGNVRHYHGLSKDAAKLPHYVSTGSSAFCVDTGDIYFYLESTDSWYKP